MIVEQVQIAGVIIDIIKIKKTKWYPLRRFFKNILLKNCSITRYLNSDVKRYMEVMEYKPYNSINSYKTWFIKEAGLKILLERITVGQGQYNETNEIRRKLLLEVCDYFGIMRDDLMQLDTKYARETPIPLEHYDFWSLLCLKNDLEINPLTIWKRCDRCNFYYPDNRKYYPKSKDGLLSDNCMQCSNRNFKCNNKILQKLYQECGSDFVYALYKRNNRAIGAELKKVIDKYDRSLDIISKQTKEKNRKILK